MLELKTTSAFRKDLKRLRKRGTNLNKLDFVLTKLLSREVLEERYKDHALIGNYIGFRECHIEPDFLLIYYIDNNKLILTAVRAGSHSDLFLKKESISRDCIKFCV